jgi:hypothetical protein
MSGQNGSGTYKSVLLYPGLGAGTEIIVDKQQVIMKNKNKGIYSRDLAEVQFFKSWICHAFFIG